MVGGWGEPRGMRPRHATVGGGWLFSFGDRSWASRVLRYHWVKKDDGVGVLVREVIRVAEVVVEHVADDAENWNHKECEHRDRDGEEGEG